jgi:hypothetical protein
MTYTTEAFVRHSLHRILRSVKYRNSFVCLPCLVTMTLESLHRGWRPSEITRALDRIYAAPGVPMESRAAFRCAHCRNVKPPGFAGRGPAASRRPRLRCSRTVRI